MRRRDWLVLLGVLCSGCEPAVRDMYDQPRLDAYAPSSLFADGQSARPYEPGVVARSGGRLAAASSGRNAVRRLPGEPPLSVVAGGRTKRGQWLPSLTSIPVPITRTLLMRGRERYEIYCAPCHGSAGDGDGMVVRRGFPAPPSYHSEALRNLPDALLYSAITNGFGRMYSYADRVPRDDRWAIVAYVRALQLSQHAPATELSPADLAALGARNR